MGERDDIIHIAFNRGREDRSLDYKGNHHWNGHKIASDLYPTDDECFEAYMQGWDAAQRREHA